MSLNVIEGNDRYSCLKKNYEQQVLSSQIVNILVYLNENVTKKGVVAL